MDAALEIALSLAVSFTVLIAFANITAKAKVTFSYIFSPDFFFYLFFLIIGNACATCVAAGLISAGDGGFSGKWLKPVWAWAAFLGVFGFQGIITRINVTVFGRGVLTIEDWTAKAEEAAVARANERFTREDSEKAVQIANDLATLPVATLNTYVTQHLGAAMVPQLALIATQTASDPNLLKSLALAYEKPREAKAIVRASARASK